MIVISAGQLINMVDFTEYYRQLRIYEFNKRLEKFENELLLTIIASVLVIYLICRLI